jgi:AcrR family transcriptional regulator
MEDVRRRAIEAAGPIFAEKGFRDATVRDICQAAGINLASVNYYFGDKERLYVAVVRHAHQRYETERPLPDGFEEQPAPQRLRAFIENLLERMLAGPEAAWERRLLLREILQPTRACEELVESAFRPQFELLLGILRELIPDLVPPIALKQLGFSVVGQCLFYRVAGEVVRLMVGAQVGQGDFAVPQLADHICDYALAAAHLASMGERTPDERDSRHGSVTTRQGAWS